MKLPENKARREMLAQTYSSEGCIVRRNLSATRTSSVVFLSIISAIGSFAHAQLTEPASSEYARAIHAVIQKQWGPSSYDSGLAPSSSCAARIRQAPGGFVLAVDFFSDCDFDKASRAAIADAVRRSEPLPYLGFESAFQRELRMVFHAASVEDRQALAADQAATRQAEKESAASDRQWYSSTGMRIRQDEYASRCSFHIRWEMRKIQVQHPTTLTFSVDKSGKIVDVAGIGKNPMDEQVAAALSATPPCEPVPTDLILGTGTIKIGPIILGSRND